MQKPGNILTEKMTKSNSFLWKTAALKEFGGAQLEKKLLHSLKVVGSNPSFTVFLLYCHLNQLKPQYIFVHFNMFLHSKET